MVNNFIKFMKKNHAWDEFLKEVQAQSTVGDCHPDVIMIQITEYVNDVHVGDSILEDGQFFFYADATTLIEWYNLDMKWRELWKTDN